MNNSYTTTKISNITSYPQYFSFFIQGGFKKDSHFVIKPQTKLWGFVEGVKVTEEEQECWEQMIDFTRARKRGVDIDELLSRL